VSLRSIKHLLLGAVLATLLSCNPASTSSTAPSLVNTPTSEIKAPPFRVIAYVTDAVVIDIIQFEKLTHINYAFLIPKEDGTFYKIANTWKLEEIISNAHENGVKVLISVGGWGWDAEFEVVAADPALRAVFVEELCAFVEVHQLDGADIDWEYPDRKNGQNFLALMQELRAALPPDKLLTAAVVAVGENGEGIPTESFEVVDFLNIMAYDGPPEQHASLAYSETALEYWRGRGLPAEKSVLGVPFYAQPNGVPYRKLIQADPETAQIDQTDYYGTTVYYNGIPTLLKKVNLAFESGSGIMFWTLEHDTTDSTSLLNAIHNYLYGVNPP
jgi:GH18 family chitinase